MLPNRCYRLKGLLANYNLRKLKNSLFAGGGQDFASIRTKIDMAYERCIEALSACIDKHLNPDGKPRFSLYNSDCWSIFLYYLSNCLKDEKDGSAEKIFYLNKVLHSVDWYYEIELPPHFIVAHPLGSVLGRATYGDYLWHISKSECGRKRNDVSCYWE